MSRVFTSKMIPNYVSDFAGSFKNLRFRIQADQANLLTYANPGVVCGGQRFFEPRHLIARFTDGSSGTFPIDTQADIKPSVLRLLGSVVNGAQVACVHLVGERWLSIPTLYVPHNPVTTPYAQPPAGKAVVLTGSFSYTSDIVGTFAAAYRIDQDPAPISTAILNCMQGRVANEPCSSGFGELEPRHAIIVAARTPATNSSILKPKINRIADISLGTPNDIVTCLTAVGNTGFCVGYQGESIRNVHLFVS